MSHETERHRLSILISLATADCKRRWRGLATHGVVSAALAGVIWHRSFGIVGGTEGGARAMFFAASLFAALLVAAAGLANASVKVVRSAERRRLFVRYQHLVKAGTIRNALRDPDRPWPVETITELDVAMVRFQIVLHDTMAITGG